MSFRGVNTAVTYVAVLQENLFFFIETMLLHIKHDFIFQQDNVIVYTVRIIKVWFVE